MTVVDAWAQHPTKRFLDQPFLATLRRWTGQDFEEVSVEATLAEMDGGGVDRALVCAWYGPRGALIANDEVAALTTAYPDRFTGIAGVDLRDPVAAVRALREAVTGRGFRGLRIVQWLWELPCTHPLYYPLFAACVELGVPACLQVGLTGPLKPSETGRPLHVERVALDFPDLTLVCGHIGYPWQQEMIALATKFPNVYIDTSAYKPKRYPSELVAYMRAHGRRKVLFGTNYPMIRPADCMTELEMLGLDDEARALFLGGNAERVFGL